MKIALLAGETSGDLLGAAVIEALHQVDSGIECIGVCGEHMQAAGCRPLASIDALSVMGLAEVVRHLPRLVRLRSDLARQLAKEAPDVVVGIDAPDFNLGLLRRLKRQGLRTAQLVSPTVWAWRAGRTRTVAASVDLLLCLLPFEPACYAGLGLRAEYVGHPLADSLDAAATPEDGRRALGLSEDGTVIGILPGSRGGELRYLAAPFAATAARLARENPDLRFIVPLAKPELRRMMESGTAAHAPGLHWTLVDGRSRDVMRAADLLLVASGTVTLEALLLGRPMVVAYRVSTATAAMLQHGKLLKSPHVSLSNLLTPLPLVPELLQGHASPMALARELQLLLDRPLLQTLQLEQFEAVRGALKRGAAGRAAHAIAALAQSPAAVKA